MSLIKFKLVIEIDGTEVFTEELGSEVVSGLAGRLPDVSENKDLFGYLAKSASSEARNEIACKENLNEETVEFLAKDSSIDVRRGLCGQTHFREWASTEILLEYISADIDCAKTIAGSVGDYSNADANKVAIQLCKHSDPDVRNALASSWSAPKKFVKQLLSDPDASVRASATRMLIGSNYTPFAKDKSASVGVTAAPIGGPTSAPNLNDGPKNTSASGTLNLNWSIKRAVVNFEDIEDDDTKAALEEVLALCVAKKYEEALEALPSIDFEFDAESMDSDASEYFEESIYAFELEKKNKNYKIQVGENNGNLILSISVVFEVKVHDGIDVDAFNEWLSDNGGWFAGNASGSWGYSEDDGGNCEVA